MLITRRQLPYQSTYLFAGRTMSFRELGRGKPVVLVHGSMMSNPWKDFENLLATKYRVYLPDLPGFGASDTVPGAVHNTDLFARALGSFIKTQGLEQAPVVALSLGCVVAAKAAAAGYHRGKLVLVGAPGKIYGRPAMMMQKIPRPLRRRLIALGPVKEKVLSRILLANIGKEKIRGKNEFMSLTGSTDPMSLVDTDYSAEIEKDFPRALETVRDRVTYIYGEKDRQKESADLLNRRYTVIKGAGHNVFRYRPMKTLKCLTGVLEADTLK